MAAAGLCPSGAVRWGEQVPEVGAGVYVIALTNETHSAEGCLASCPTSPAALDDWLDVRPELRLDGQRPTEAELARRLAAFWLPDEVILYIGLAGTSLRTRLRQYYQTPLGARRPHAGGHFLKTLENLDELHVHFVPTANPQDAEDAMLGSFCRHVSDASRGGLHDPDHPFPFANLEWPPGTRKRHGLIGTKGDLPAGTGTSVPKGPTADKRRRVGSAATARITLHEEIERILRERGNTWMTTQEVASAVNDAGNYRKKDGSAVTAFQIHGRTRNYSRLFERDGSRVRLRA
jgi:hypothetical protein